MSNLKRKISRLVKKTLISLKLDAFVSNQFHNTHWLLFKKLIPDRTYYRKEDMKTILRYNVRFKIRPADFTQWRLFADQTDVHIDAILSVLKPDAKGLILDIGANCGSFSLVVAQSLKQKKWSKQLIAFEPNPQVFASLHQNLSLNPQIKNSVQLVNKGVGEKASTLTLQIPTRNTGAGSLIRNYDQEPHEKVEIDIISLDEFLGSEHTAVELMKIDVENFEYYVLAGATQLIAKYKPAIYIEMGHGQLKQKEILSLFKSHDYTLYGENNGKFVLLETEDPAVIEKYSNLLAVNRTVVKS